MLRDCLLSCTAVSRLRTQALASFSEGLRDVSVPGTNWDTAEPSNAFEEAVDAWTEQLRQQQVLTEAQICRPPACCCKPAVCLMLTPS